MTLHATRDGQKITINGNTGVSLDVMLSAQPGAPHLVMNNGYAQYVRITEDAQHVRHFWAHLGKLIEEAEAEAKAERERELEGRAEAAMSEAIDREPQGN
jgi:hypothetical protein